MYIGILGSCLIRFGLVPRSRERNMWGKRVDDIFERSY